MADWVDLASRPFNIHSGEVTTRQIVDGDSGSINRVDPVNDVVSFL